MRTTIDRTSIQPGTDVYGSDQDHIGSIAEVGENYLLVQKGMFFPKDIYVPFSAVTQASTDMVVLNVTKGQIESQGWDQPPHEGLTTGSSMTETTSDRERLRLHEEELEARKTARQAGEVEVQKNVVEERKGFDVPVSREEVRVRRVPVDRDASPDDAAFRAEGETIRVPVTEEDVEVTKRPRVKEEIEIEKVARHGTKRVEDTVRREEVDVRGRGDARVREGLDEQGRYRHDGDDDLAGQAAGGTAGALGGAAVGGAVAGPAGAVVGGALGAAGGAAAGDEAEDQLEGDDLDRR